MSDLVLVSCEKAADGVTWLATFGVRHHDFARTLMVRNVVVVDEAVGKSLAALLESVRSL